MIVKKRTNVLTNLIPSKVPIHVIYTSEINSMCTPQDVEPSVISYATNQLIDL